MTIAIRRRPSLLAVLLLALTGCSSAIAGSAGPDPEIQLTSDVAELRVGGQPAWGSAEVAVPNVDAVRFGTDTAVVVGGAVWPSEDAAIAGVELDTGEVRWSYPSYGALAGGNGASFDRGFQDIPPQIVAVGDEELVIVSYFATSCTDDTGWCPADSNDVTDEVGVAALSLRDGTVRWKTATVPGVDPNSPEAEEYADLGSVLVGAGPQGVLVTVGDSQTVHSNEPGAVRSLLLDPATGVVRWEAPDTRAVRLVGDNILAAVPTTGDGLDGIGVLDPATGTIRWSTPVISSTFSPLLSVWAAVGDTALLWVSDTGAEKLQQIDLTDGALVGPPRDMLNCADNGTDLIACLSVLTEIGLLSWGPTAGAPPTSGLPLDGDLNVPALVVDGYVFVADFGSAHFRAFDRNGIARSEQLDGRVIAFGSGYLAVVSTGAGDPAPWAVYRVR